MEGKDRPCKIEDKVVLNSVLKQLLGIIALVFVLQVLVSCASSAGAKKQPEEQAVTLPEPEEEEIPAIEKTQGDYFSEASPFEFFNVNKDIYCSVPVKGNEELVTAIMQKVVPDASPSAQKTLLSKADFFYCGSTLDFLFDEEKPLLFQFVVTGNLPVAFRSMLFTAGNGFRQVIEERDGETFTYYHSPKGNFFVTIPESGYCFASREYLSEMIVKQRLTAKEDTRFLPDWDESVKKHMLSEPVDGIIDWYFDSPESVIKLLLGENVKLPVKFAFGTMKKRVVQKPESLLYSLDAVLELTDKRFVNPDVTLLNRYLKLYNDKHPDYPAAKAEAGEENRIHLKNIVIDVYKMLSKLYEGEKNEQ